MNVVVEHDKKADTVYLQFSNDKVAYSRRLDRERVVDYSQDGEIRGIRFLSASSGVNTEDLPYRSAIERAFNHKGFARLAPGNVAGGRTAEIQRTRNTASVPVVSTRSKVLALSRASAAILTFAGGIVASVILARNLFVLSSLPGFVASILGLVVALLPTVLGCFILLAWLFDVRDQGKRS
jgi:uncharacterized protein YuzE